MPDKIHPSLEALAVDIDSIALLNDNPRKGDVEAVKRSYETFGQRKPIVVQADGMVTEDGNHQLMAARSLGWTRIAAVICDDDELTAKAYALAANQTGRMGSMDDALVTEMLAELVVDPDLLAATAYTPLEIAGMLGETVGLPTFQPEDNNPRLDQRNPTCCPSCGFEWREGPGGAIEPV